ncbi:hypothetical protein SEVIR_2G007800v4 [Setaria viridis]|uniref:ATPase AAA-type core domain-containing protein n=2 Tax=Setaria viridis TaxID=4556 RepID=A0A4U6VMX6_SETVI|nr:AAA-ATPase At3g28580-like [Setaria viridis]TKW30034.1 hypothetical protein SEVIR_2G007800v2 [Setaria viridis]
MMATMKQWVSDGIRSAGFLFWAPLLASYVPRGLPNMYFNLHLRRYARRLVPLLDPFVTIDIVSKKPSSSMFAQPYEYGQCSDAYKEVKAYLTKLCSRDALAFRADGTVDGRSFLLNLRQGQEVTDHFQGVTVWWLLVPRNRTASEKSRLRLMFPHRHRALIVDKYLPHVRRQGRENMLVTIDIVVDSMAVDKASDAFNEVKAYLSSACSRDALNLRAKGTDKDDSFLVSLHEGEVVADRFRDVTLWWFSVPTTRNGRLEELRLKFPQQHRVLILDEYLPHVRRQGRNVMFGKRRQTLYTNNRGFGGGDERIIVLTTNFPEKLDPALIRRGRMDMHIEMSYCCFEAFKMLASNYLGVEDHPLFQRVEELLQVVEIIPADVAECLLMDEATGSDRGVETCLGRLIEELEKKAQEQKGKVGNIAAAKPKRQRR